MDDFISPPAPVQAAAARRAGIAPWARIGLLGIAAAALVAVAILAFGSTASPTGTLAAGTGTTGTTGSSTVDNLNGLGGPGARGGLGRGFGGITIKSISGNNLSLETADGWTRTITVDSGTTYSKSGATIALGDLAVGDQIGFRQTHETDGTWTIDSVVVIPPHAGGIVTAVSGSTITVTQRDGIVATITVTGSTTYKLNGNAATLADIKVGMIVVGEGTKNADGSITATTVHAGDRNGRGPGGHGPDGKGHDLAPNATAAPSATGTAS